MAALSRRHRPIFVVVLAAAALLAACGGPGSSVGAEPKAWESMSGGEKADHMKTVVMPEMGKVFQGHDADEFGNFKCSTCHGKGAATGQFHMPSPDLPKLTKELTASHPKMTAFMKETVTPTMGELLPGEKVTCGTCHPH